MNNVDTPGQENIEEMLESEESVEEDKSGSLSYEDFKVWVTEEFREDFISNSNPVGMGIESENQIVDSEDDVMPSSPVYQEILNEDLWENIEKELDERVKGYGEEFEFEFEIKRKGHGEDKPAEFDIKVTGDPANLIGPPAADWDLGAQLELDSGAYEVSKSGNGDFDFLLDVLKSFKKGSENYIESNFEDLEFADEGLTEQYRNPEEFGTETLKKGIRKKWGREEAKEFIEKNEEGFTDVEYYKDYVWSIFGPNVLVNIFGGSTQLTSGLYSENGNLDVDQKISEEMPYRMLFEQGLDVLTSNTTVEQNGEPRHTGVNEEYWEETHEQHVVGRKDIEETKESRYGTPWELLERITGASNALEKMVDYYMTEHNMVWIKPPEEEHVEFDEELEGERGYNDFTLLALDPEHPKTPKEYIEDGEVRFTKVISPEKGEFERVSGTVDLENMSDHEKEIYHKENFDKAHLAGIHHDVRPKFSTGGFEYRVGRQNFDEEYSVALAKAAVTPHGEAIREAFEERSIDPRDQDSVPDLHNEEDWSEIYDEVYSVEVMETAEKIAPKYFEQFKDYVNTALEYGAPGKNQKASNKK